AGESGLDARCVESRLAPTSARPRSSWPRMAGLGEPVDTAGTHACENPMTRAWLSLGSNLEPEQHLRAALRELRTRFGTLRVSSVYQSEAVGFDGPPFWNLAVGLESDLDLDALNAWLHELEERQGRRRDQPRYADRTLDMD